MFKFLKRQLPVIALVLAFVLGFNTIPVLAGTTADVTVNATGQYLSIAVNNATYDFGAVAASATPSTGTSYFLITNTSTVTTEHTIKVTAATWTSGGTGWTHNDAATPGANTVALLANKGGTWGTGDVNVKYNTAYEKIATSQAATTNYSFGLKLLAPTTFTDGYANQNTVRITVSAT